MVRGRSEIVCLEMSPQIERCLETHVLEDSDGGGKKTGRRGGEMQKWGGVGWLDREGQREEEFSKGERKA